MSTVTKTPTSSDRHRIKLRGTKFSGVFRVANFEELARCHTYEDDVVRMEKLYDVSIVEAEQKHTKTARQCFGIQLLRLAGNASKAEVLPEDDLCDEAADALVAYRTAHPERELICISMNEMQFVFIMPGELAVDGLLKAKTKTRDILGDMRLVRDCVVFGDLDFLAREKPAGICELSRLLLELGGMAYEAEVEKL